MAESRGQPRSFLPEFFVKAAARWPGLYELFDGQVSIDQKLRATGKVGNRRGAHVNSQPMIQRRKDFLVMDRAILWDLAKTIGRTDDLASSHSASC